MALHDLPAIYIYIYNKQIIRNLLFLIKKVLRLVEKKKFGNCSRGQPEAPFSLATTPRCRRAQLLSKD